MSGQSSICGRYVCLGGDASGSLDFLVLTPQDLPVTLSHAKNVVRVKKSSFTRQLHCFLESVSKFRFSTKKKE